MSQNKSIVAQNQNYIPSSKGNNPGDNGNVNNGIATKNQSFAAKSEDSRTAENGFMSNANGNASKNAAEHGTRNKN